MFLNQVFSVNYNRILLSVISSKYNIVIEKYLYDEIKTSAQQLTEKMKIKRYIYHTN
jgi:hypothetical protein